jgi:hypothetical protein
VEGLRISTKGRQRKQLTPADTKAWERAKTAYNRDGNLDAVLAHVAMSQEHREQLMRECLPEREVAEDDAIS